MANYLKPIQAQDLPAYLTEREGETKLGQAVQLLSEPFSQNSLTGYQARFVLVGIPEDIGVRANSGKPGTAGFWKEFLKVFLNIQSNHFLQGNQILLAGEVDCDDLMKMADGKNAADLHTIVQQVDLRVEKVLTEIFAAGKIPLVIGGGHNNAYPIIKSAQKVFKKKINIINIDPHADLRKTGQRHSGNGFSQALEEGLIHFYLQVGLHESYNNTHILDLYKTKSPWLHYFSFDDFLKGRWTMEQLETFIRDQFSDLATGFELDTDSIAHFPSSAQTPTGFDTNDIRRLTMMISRLTQPIYFHLPEAIPATTPLNSMKMAAYLISDFIKNYDGKTS